jgi:uncharacterized membrane protein YbhN (UPF0104 family)
MFFTNNFAEIKRIFAIKVYTLVSLSCLVLSTQFVNGLRMKVLTDSLNLRLEPRDWMGVAIVQSFLNYLPLKGGMFANAVYLKRWHNFSYMKFISMIGSSGLITILSVGFIGFFISSFYYFYRNISVIMPCFFLSLVTFTLLFIAFSVRFDSSGGALKRLNQVIEGWNMIRTERTSIVSLMALDLLSAFIFSMRYYIAFRAFSLNISFWYCLMLAPLSILTTFISITPAGLGIREAVIGFTSKILGMGLNPGMYAASLDRAVVMFWVFILGPIFGYILIDRKRIPPNGERP